MNNIEVATCNDLFDDILANSSINVTQKAFDGYDCIVMPSPYREHEYYYAQETIDFIKFCREKDHQLTIDTLDDEGIEIRSLHSFDIFLPIIWIAREVLLPIAISLVGSYIYDKMKGREHEEANVELSFIVERNGEKKMLHYKGSANEFEKEFKAIDLSDL